MSVAQRSIDAPRFGPPAGPPWLYRGRIPSLDGLRAVAVLFVLVCHAQFTPGFEWDLPEPMKLLGRLGVDVFFVLSGFLITTLILREFDRTGRLEVRAFFLRRFLRIVPAYVCYLSVLALLQVAGYVDASGRDWLAALTYTVNFVHDIPWEMGHIWSLSVEEHFYLAWPLVMAAGVAAGRRTALGCVAFCCGLRLALVVAWPAGNMDLHLWTFTRLDTIAAGCLLALLARNPAGRAALEWLTRWAWLPVLVIVLPYLAHPLSHKIFVATGSAVTAVGVALTVWWAMHHEHNLLGRLLNCRVMQAIGLGSYSIYLWQQLFLARGHEANIFITFPQNLLFALLAAFLSYQLIEKPFLNLKARLAEPAPRARAELPAMPRRARRTAIATAVG